MKGLDINIKLGAALLLLGILAVLAGCSGEEASAETGAVTPPSFATVAVPGQKNVAHLAEYTGLTEAREDVSIRTREEGGTYAGTGKMKALIKRAN